MPENFNEQLSGLVDAAAGAAGTPGAEAARRRGRQRRIRRRAAASALALALVCGAGSAAALTLGNGPQHTPAAGPSAVPSASPASTPSTSSIKIGQTQVPSDGVATAKSLATPSDVSPSINPDPAASGPVGYGTTTTTPNPEVVVPAAWLSASQMPFADDGAYQLTQSTGSQLGDSVALDRTPIEFCDEDINGTALSALGDGASGQQYRGFSSLPSGLLPLVGSQTFPAYPAQQLLFYPDAATAQAAWDALPADFAACKQQMTSVDPSSGTRLTGWVQQTVNESDAECWSTLTTGTDQQSTNNGGLTHHCFVRSGSLIAGVDVDVHEDGSFALVDFSQIDASTISALRQALSAEYGSGS